LSEYSARQVFGETTVLSPAVLPYKSVAQTQTTFLRVSGDQLYRMMSLHPTLAKGFIGELSKRLRQEQIKKI
jgi:CRP-like cAMP-binding protein